MPNQKLLLSLLYVVINTTEFVNRRSVRHDVFKKNTNVELSELFQKGKFRDIVPAHSRSVRPGAESEDVSGIQ